MLFYTQAALAASGCLMPSLSMAKAVAGAEQPAQCDGGKMNLNLCVTHCNGDSQTLGGESIAHILPITASAFLIVSPPASVSELRSRARALAAPCVDPPKSILFCSFLS